MLYLAWGLREAAFSEEKYFLYLLPMVVFALVGAVLLFFSIRRLFRKDKDADGEETKKDDS